MIYFVGYFILCLMPDLRFDVCYNIVPNLEFNLPLIFGIYHT